MKYQGVCIAVKDVTLSKHFIKNYLYLRFFKIMVSMCLLEDYRCNRILIVKRFLSSGMSMAEVSKRMDVSAADLEKLLAD